MARTTALVTGATGFLGRHVVRELVARGVIVHALFRRPAQAQVLRALGAVPFPGDVTDAPSLDLVTARGADVIFHMAADTNIWRQRNAQQTRVNVDGTRNLLDAAQRYQVPAFVHTSSVSAMGVGNHTLLRDDAPLIAKDSKHNYARTKALAEEMVWQAADDHGLKVIVTYPSHLLGPGDTQNWSRMFRMIEQDSLPGVPPGSGPFADVREVALAHVRAWERQRFGECYLLGGEHASFLHLLTLAARRLGRRVPAKAMSPKLLRTVARAQDLWSLVTRREPKLTPEGAALVCHDLRVDSSKAIGELDFRIVKLTKLVDDTLGWMRATGHLQPAGASA